MDFQLAIGGRLNSEDFKGRTKAYALRILHLVESLPRSMIARTIGDQLLRCGTSVGSNYRAACRARSRADFISKMGIVEEECDESLYWMELLIEAKLVKDARLSALMKEGIELHDCSLKKNGTLCEDSLITFAEPYPVASSFELDPSALQSAIGNPQPATVGLAVAWQKTRVEVFRQVD